MRKLKDIINYYENENIIIICGNIRINWGKHSKHIIERYYNYLLEKNVINTSIDWQGKKILILK